MDIGTKSFKRTIRYLKGEKDMAETGVSKTYTFNVDIPRVLFFRRIIHKEKTLEREKKKNL
jgi:hypothetical protein